MHDDDVSLYLRNKAQKAIEAILNKAFVHSSCFVCDNPVMCVHAKWQGCHFTCDVCGKQAGCND